MNLKITMATIINTIRRMTKKIIPAIKTPPKKDANLLKKPSSFG
jgi:hypothetical protein